MSYEDLDASYLEEDKALPISKQTLSLKFSRVTTLTLFVEESSGRSCSSIGDWRHENTGTLSHRKSASPIEVTNVQAHARTMKVRSVQLVLPQIIPPATSPTNGSNQQPPIICSLLPFSRFSVINSATVASMLAEAKSRTRAS